MIVRLVWYMLLLLTGAVAVFAQTDRQSRRDPEMARFVPPAFQSFALPHNLADAIARGDTTAAQQTAQRLVERRPVPAEHLTGLAIARLSAGEAAQSAAAIRLAANRGWRNLPAQEAMLRAAMQEGDSAQAAKRLAAIWALHPASERTPGLTQLVLVDPVARAAFAQELANGARWPRHFVRSGQRVIGQPMHAAILRDARTRGARF